MKVTFNSKSNFKNCNGKELEVAEISGTRISVIIPRYGFNQKNEPVGNYDTVADFNISEIFSFGMRAYTKPELK